MTNPNMYQPALWGRRKLKTPRAEMFRLHLGMHLWLLGDGFTEYKSSQWAGLNVVQSN